tara:strand:- start:63 stop:245 length:183 start_codon:yes stop_codon:yes gene_type:complete
MPASVILSGGVLELACRLLGCGLLSRTLLALVSPARVPVEQRDDPPIEEARRRLRPSGDI